MMFDSAGDAHLQHLLFDSFNTAHIGTFGHVFQSVHSQMCGQFCLFVLFVVKVLNPIDIVETLRQLLPNVTANEFLMYKFTFDKKIGEEFWDPRYRNIIADFDYVVQK